MTMNIKDLFSFKNKKNWKVVLVEDVPAEVINNRIYLVGEQNIWLIVFRCPCGCAETIQLNTLDTDDPFCIDYFAISYKKMTPTSPNSFHGWVN